MRALAAVFGTLLHGTLGIGERSFETAAGAATSG